MDDKQLRKIAVQRYLNGEKPKQIYTSLNRSKKWFFKWLKRFQSGQPGWNKNQSRRPRNCPNKLASIDKQRIIEIRRNLESQPFAQTGVSAIKWELKKSGFDLPSDTTINRVLKNAGLVKKNRLRSQRR